MALAQLIDENRRRYQAGYQSPQSAPQSSFPSSTPGLLPNYENASPGMQMSDEVAAQFNPNAVLDAAKNSSQGYQPKKGSGNPQTDFLALANGYSPSAKNLEAFFPQFQSMYPGWNLKKNASGYADSITGPNGEIIDTQVNSGYDKSDAWQWSPAGMTSAYSSQFSDPLTSQYEQLLQQQTGMYQQQQAAWQQEQQRLQATRAQQQQMVDKLLSFVNQRVEGLKQPAYTGQEAEVLRTRALDPIESDRQASRKRALENIGSRGFDPSSGIAQELLSQVDRGYDTQRAGAQNDLAYKQIEEERSRQQEAQSLMQYAAQLPEAAATGDLNFMQLLNTLANTAGQSALGTRGLLADLPVQRTQLAANIANMGGQPASTVPNYLALLNQAQQNRYLGNQTNATYWQNLAASLGL
jgi:formiminotetrahydrofolate cyclodeaminase